MAAEIKLAYDNAEEIDSLFSEYTQMLAENDPSFVKYLEIQNYEAETAHLSEKYGLPYGRLYIAHVDEVAAGCVGLRRLDEARCEMKRLYVRPEYRGQNIANQLLDLIISDAKSVGYKEMLLDTLPFLGNAIHLYRKYGFYEIESYNNSPMDTSIYMKLDLRDSNGVIELREDTKKAAHLFENIQESIIWSCLDKTMGSIYADHLEHPVSAMAMLGDFCFLAGQENRELVSFKPAECSKEFIIMVPENERWSALIEEVYGEKARKVTRYALKKEAHIWDLDKLREIVYSLPSGFELKLIDEDIFQYARQHGWASDWVSQFTDYADYRANGLGVAVVKDGVPVSGASSYSYYSKGIEIEVDTHPDYRRQGLAAACSARLILECEKLGLYPSWDAQNLWSVALAEKLGYHYSHEYTAYEIEYGRVV